MLVSVANLKASDDGRTDTPGARRRAIAYVSRIEYRWCRRYPFGTDFDTEIVLQLGRWCEVEALSAPRRLAW